MLAAPSLYKATDSPTHVRDAPLVAKLLLLAPVVFPDIVSIILSNLFNGKELPPYAVAAKGII